MVILQQTRNSELAVLPVEEISLAPDPDADASAQPAAPAVPTLPQTGTTGWMAGVLASLSSLLLACGWFFTRKSKHS